MKAIIRWLTIGIGILFVGVSAYRWEFPYGRRTCFLPCTMSALRAYALDNNGWFPKDDANTGKALAKLSPLYLPDIMLAGLSGDQSRFQRGISLAELMSADESSWVYQSGLRSDDPSEIALIWDKAGGVKGNGGRLRRGGHCVGFVDGEIRTIAKEEWSSFTNRQAEIRVSVIANRAATNSTPVIPN